MAAVTDKGGEDKSLKEMVLEPVLTEGYEHLKNWLEGRLETTLGSSADKDTPIVQNFTYHGMPPNGQSPFVEQGGSTGNVGGSTEYDTSTVSNGNSEKGALTPLQLAALKGYCGAIWDHELDIVWTELQGTNDVEDARTYLQVAFEESRKALKIDPSECNDFFLEDSVIKEWKKCKFAPGGSIPVFEYFMRGMSILLCSNFSPEAQLKSRDKERAYNDTPYTRTPADAERRDRKEPRQPPMTWSGLKYLINTYAIFLHALFTSQCPLFRSVWGVREVLGSMRQRQRYFTKEVCAMIVYHIIKDAMQFFSVKLMPRDFEGAVIGEPRSKDEINWPVSHLHEISKIIHGLQLGQLDVVDLPEKWRYHSKEEKEEKDTKRQASDGGGRVQGGPQLWRQQQYGGTGQGGYGGSNGSGHGGGYQGNGGYGNQGGGGYGKQHNVMAPQFRPKLGAVCDECMRLNPLFGHAELRQFGGLEMWNLPKMNKYVKEGKNHACNGGLLGICRFTDDTCKFQRVDHRDLPNDFVDAFINVVGPALDKCRDALRQGKKITRPEGYRSRGAGGRMF